MKVHQADGGGSSTSEANGRARGDMRTLAGGKLRGVSEGGQKEHTERRVLTAPDRLAKHHQAEQNEYEGG
eukprot:8092328-Alexandrium_andersonii.AAC.1